jgi:hypothetical protein
MSSVRGYDNLYNESVNDIALMNYNKGIAHRLRLQEQEMQNKLPFKEPKLLTGGVRASNSIVAGTSIDAVPRAVGGRASRRFTGEETPAEGGKINRFKKSQKWTGYAKDTIGDAFDIAKMAGMGKGMVYSQDLQKALGGCGECSGGAKKRSGRFAKGSAEAKAWGQKMKEARMKK